MGRSCFHKGCRSGYNDKKYGASHVFKVPNGATEELKRKWIQNIPKQLHRNFNVITDSICHLHFEDEYIIKQHFITYDNKKVSQGPRKRWKIDSEAVPTKFSNAEVSVIYDRKNNKRKPPAERKFFTGNKRKKIDDPPLQSSAPDEAQNQLSQALELDVERIRIMKS